MVPTDLAQTITGWLSKSGIAIVAVNELQHPNLKPLLPVSKDDKVVLSEPNCCGPINNQ
jgi:hypothetical protein